MNSEPSEIATNRTGYFSAFQKFWALAAIGLLGVTWRLWFAVTDFPAVPVWELLCSVPTVVDHGLCGLLLTGLLVVLWSRQSGAVRLGLVLFASAMVGLILLNQHRLQPWAYQFVVYAIVMAACPRSEAMRRIRWIAISIYVYSALSKFDYQFTESLGQDFLRTALDFAKVDSSNWTAAQLSRSVLLFPAIELLLAVGLMMRWSRSLAGWGIVLMHGALILILGPWGLQHQWGVLLWNVFLLGQALFIFCFPSVEQDSLSQRSLVGWMANLLVGFVLVFPLSATVDVCDHWLAWEVYAPRSSRANLEFSAEEIEKLPAELKSFCYDSPKQIGAVEISLEKWSLQTLKVPIYPENRVHFAVAREIVRRFDLRNFRCSVGADSNRWNGERKWKVIDRVEKLESEADVFWLNTSARRPASPTISANASDGK